LFCPGPLSDYLPADEFDQVVVFGDSLSDTGNLYNVTSGGYPFADDPLEGPALFPTPPYYQGRITNGPNYVEHLATKLGTTVDAVQAFGEPIGTPTAGGTNYAFGGAETPSSPLLSTLGTPNLGTQVTFFSLNPLAAPLTGDSLIVIYGGSNDFNNASGALPDPSDLVNNIAAHITTLTAQGGRNFMVPNLIALGDTPRGRLSGNADELNLAVAEFNAALDARLDELETELGIATYRPDFFALYEQIQADPEAFGLTNVTDPAFDSLTGTVVSNPDEYLFFDTLHPTRIGHQFAGELAYSTVPEPSTVTLCLIVSLLSLAWRGRRAGRL
jgi:phospholipase/lecithinase/hemolysin